MSNNTRLTPLEKIGYGLGDFASNVGFQSILILLPVFYTDTFGLSPAVMGTLFLVVRALDAIIDPAMGIIADHTNTRWGKYRPYLLWFSVPFALTMVLTYTTPSFGPTGKIVYASITYGLLMVLYTMVNIPYCALGGVITADSQERVSANSYRFFLATSAGVLIAALGPGMVKTLGGDDPKVGYTWTMAAFGVLAVIAFIACFALTRERVTQVSDEKGTLGQEITTLLRNDQWVIIAALFFVLLIGIVLRAGSAAYYIKWFAARPDLTAAFLTTGTVAQMIGASTASWFTARMDKVPSYILAQVIVGAGSIALYFTPAGNIALIMALYALINFFVQLGAPILFAMAADTVEYGELKTGRRVTGLVFSGALLMLKLGVAVGGWLIGLILAGSGYSGQAETQTPEAIKAILLSVTLLPAVAHLLLIPIVSLYKLNRKRCSEIRQQLDAKATAG